MIPFREENNIAKTVEVLLDAVSRETPAFLVQASLAMTRDLESSKKN